MDNTPICLVINNRIGNILFQISAVATLAQKNNTTFFCVPDTETTKEYVEQFKTNVFRKIKFVDQKPNGLDLYKEDTAFFKYKEIIYKQNLEIFGLFQSDKYFDKETIFELFKPTNECIEEIKELYPIIFDKNCISINVRRGDYLRMTKEFNVCSDLYYKEIISEFGNEYTYIITSDDIDWCKKNFNGDNFIFIDKDCSNKIVIDLYVQTLCKHNILSCSSFSWWGAYLNQNIDKKIIVPDPWFGDGLNFLDTSDLIPKEWTKKQVKTI